MTIGIQDIKLDVYQGRDRDPTVERDPDFTISTGELSSVEIEARAHRIMDEASFTILNSDNRYTETYQLNQGDRLVFVAPLEKDAAAYGEGWYGAGQYGSIFGVVWTGRIGDIDGARNGPSRSALEIEARDFPADVLTNRQITNSYIGEDVGAIIRDIIRRKAPEVDNSTIPDLDVVTDAKYSSADCWDAIISLAARADAVVIPNGRALHVEAIGNLPYAFEIQDQDVYLPIKQQQDDEIKNVVRIDSGESRKLEASQPTVDESSWQILDAENPVTYRLRARKSEVHSVELYLRLLSNDEVKVRLQSDEGGEPVAIDDEDSDIASATWQADDLEDGWNTMFFSDHILADRDPWLIVQSGDDGHEIAHNAANELTYRSYYPHPLNFEVASTDSINQYGMREIRLEKSDLKTLTAARDAARGELARRAWPSKSVEADARSQRAHALHPGRRVDINRPQDDVEGEHIITEIDRSWEAGSMELQTTLVAEWRKGVLAPQH